ncbi:MAG: TIGR02206 family membrane protein [Vulcanimicrobiota bacterium]
MSGPFQLFGPSHVGALLLTGVGCAIAFQASRGEQAEAVRKASGIGFFLFLAVIYGERFWSGFQPGLDLPLQVCDVVFLVCLVGFWRAWPGSLDLVYFWGLAGTMQALLTPDVPHGFPSREFCLFFAGHGLILLGLTVLLTSRGYRAERAGPWRAWLALVGYTVLVGSLDLATGWNYGYLLRKPQQATLLDHLGGWPFYVVVGLLVALMLFLLLYLPWVVFGRTPNVSPELTPTPSHHKKRS